MPLPTPILKTELLTIGAPGFTLAMSTVVFVAVEAEKLTGRRSQKGAS